MRKKALPFILISFVLLTACNAADTIYNDNYGSTVPNNVSVGTTESTAAVSSTITPKATLSPKPQSDGIPTRNPEDPHYKLLENIRLSYRPEWAWDEEKQEYIDTGNLVRDPDTGLFPEPEEGRPDLEDHASWDPLLGLYIVNDIKINHETGEIKEGRASLRIPGMIITPPYNVFHLINKDDIDKKYISYENTRYYAHNEVFGKGSSKSLSIRDLVNREYLELEWFKVKFSELKAYVEKMIIGMNGEYGITTIEVTTKVYSASKAESKYFRPDEYRLWQADLNTFLQKAREGFEIDEARDLGYLALPYIEDKVRVSEEGWLDILPSLANGLFGLVWAEAEGKTLEQWLTWFDENREELDALREFISEDIIIPWFEPVE